VAARGPAAAAPPLPVQAGDLLGGRYRLERLRAERAACSLWRALDEVLARSVAVKVVPVSGRRAAGGVQAEEIREAVSRAGRVTDPRLARVLDVDELEVGRGRYCYVVSEWLDLPSLGALVRAELLSAAQATDVAWQVADTLHQAIRAGACHGRLHPGNVLLHPGGAVKVTDLEVARVIAREDAEISPEHRQAQDARAIGGLLYAALTGYWPVQPAGGLPAAPMRAGRLCRPRQVRAAVPRELDSVAERLLGLDPALPAVDTPAKAAALLQPLPRTPPGVGGGAAPEDRAPSRLRVWARRVVPLVGLVAIGLVSYLVGVEVGRVPPPPQSIPAFTAPTPSGGASPFAPIPVSAVSDFNPEGTGPENPQAVRLAVDGDPATAWYTSRYYGNPNFGGLKQGTGLLIDLGSPRRIRAVRVAFVLPGASVQLRAADRVGADAPEFRLAAAMENTPQTFTLTPAQPVSARYWLVWLTRLPSVGNNTYQEGVAEVAFYG